MSNTSARKSTRHFRMFYEYAVIIWMISKYSINKGSFVLKQEGPG